MNRKPFFSIVLPTLNRADYLPFAIRSALNQTFEDFELIVSDNSSTDDTEQIAKSFADERIRYVKTEKILPMYESFEFALEKASGEYITFLGDDDAHSRIYLESLKKIIDKHKARVVSCRMADYHYQKPNSRKSEFLTTPAFTNKLFIQDSRRLIKDIYIENRLCKGKPQKKSPIPQLINTAYHHTIFAEIKNDLGKVFPQVLAGDYYLAAVALSFTEKYFFLDSPLSFHGISPQSATASITNQPKGTELKTAQPELAVFRQAPLKNIFVNYNFVADALMLAKSDLSRRLDYFDLDMTGYFVTIYNNFYLLEQSGRDTTEEKREFFAAVERQKSNIREEIKSAISNKKNILKNKLELNFYTGFIYQFLRDLRRFKFSKNLVIKGNKMGFSNIAECAELVEHKFLKSYESNR